MTDDERQFFRTIADREPPTEPVNEVWIIGGRRAGKDSVASVLAAHVSAMFEDTDRLRPGERGVVLCLACDRDQAKIVLNYTKSYFTDVPMLAGMVTGETAFGFELNNGIDIMVATNSFRSVRGRPVLCAIFDEMAFWRDETSATPDEETYKAVKPGLASLPGSIIIGISSPYRKKGLLYKKYQDHFGKPSKVLVIKAPTALLNPTIDPTIISDALADDPESARAEWMAEFRDDISDFISRRAVMACVEEGIRERAFDYPNRYVGFCDPSGGSSDSMTLAIAHKSGDTAVLDVIREIKPPFNPESVVAEFCDLLKKYRISTCIGDNYAGQWVASQFGLHGIHWRLSERTASALFLDFLPLLNSRGCALLDDERAISQICALERRTRQGGKDAVGHPPGGHDDIANAIAGALVNVPSAARRDRPAGGVQHESSAKYNVHNGTYGARR
jgi:hypothetical protein